MLWLVRERLAQLVVPREPEEPVSPPPPPPPAEPDDFTAISGIGPVYAERLLEAGISRFSELATAEEARVAEILGVSEERAGRFVEAARRLAGPQ